MVDTQNARKMRPSGLIRTFAYAAAHIFLSQTENIIVGIVDRYSISGVRLKRLRYLILVSHKKCAFVTGGRLRRTREISRESELISGVSNITHAYAPPSEERHSPFRYRSARKLGDSAILGRSGGSKCERPTWLYPFTT